MGRTYITDAQQLVTLALAGIQTVFECDRYSQPDEIFKVHRDSEVDLLYSFQRDLNNGYRFYLDTE